MGRPLFPPAPQGRRRDLRAPPLGLLSGPGSCRVVCRVMGQPPYGPCSCRRQAPDEDTAGWLFLLANTDGALNIFAK